MTHEQKTAIARIISDMIKADNIIEESEIRFMKQLMTAYSLSSKEMCDARNMRFSEAVVVLQELRQKERKQFFDRIYSVAMSDNACVPKEALLLLALQYCLVDYDRRDADGRKLPKPYLISCPSGESSMNDQYMVYLESDYDQKLNDDIKANFELMVLKSRMNGFNFVYIPKMVEEFKAMDERYVKDVIYYMAPHLPENVVDDVYDRLCQMTTNTFYRNVLCEKLKVQALYNAKPTLLINVGTSVVPYCVAEGSVQYYTEFLCIPITESVKTMVDDILFFYNSKVSVKTLTITDNSGQFKYFGFYKALFDFLIAPPPVAPDLIFLGQDMKTGRYHVAFRFEEGRERLVHLTPQRYDIYYQIAKKSCDAQRTGLPAATISSASISHIKQIIADSLKDVSYVEQYKPDKKGNSYILKLDKDKVFLRKYDTSNRKQYIDIPLSDCQ